MKVELSPQDATDIVNILDQVVKSQGLVAAPFAIRVKNAIEFSLQEHSKQEVIAEHKQERKNENQRKHSRR